MTVQATTDWLRRAVDVLLWRVPAVVWLPLAAGISLALHWRLFDLPMVSDEGGYAYVAQRWLDGRGQLYDDLWLSRPQGIYLVYALILRFLGGDIVDLRTGSWIAGLVTMIGVWLFAAAWKGPKVAAGASLIFAVLMASPATEGFTANAEIFMAAPAAFSAWCLLRAARSGWAWPWILGAGALAGLATILKPSGIVMLPVAIGFLVLARLSTEGMRAKWQVAAGSAVATLGFAIGVMPFLVHGYILGWDRYLYGAVTYRIFNQSSATNTIEHHLNALFRLLARSWPLAAAVVCLLALRWFLDGRRDASVGRPVWTRPMAGRLTAARVGFLPAALDWSAIVGKDRVRLLLRLWFLGCLAGIAMGGDWWFHYLIQAAAPLAIWIALALSELRSRLTAGRWLLTAAAVVVLLLLPYSVLAKPTRAAMTEALFGHPGYADQEALADYLRENTVPETPIFIAFDQPSLYYLADLPAAYPYLYDQELQALPESQGELIALLESPTRPLYVVGTRQVAPYEDRGRAFWETVKEYYVLETTVRGVPIYRNIDAPPPDER